MASNRRSLNRLETLLTEAALIRSLPHRSATLNAFAAMSLLSGAGVTWGYFILQFGWAGALLGWWPAAVIGGGGVLAVLQLLQVALAHLRDLRGT
jgi:hypothetical protein